jgi:hypothetical protein
MGGVLSLVLGYFDRGEVLEDGVGGGFGHGEADFGSAGLDLNFKLLV